MHLKKRRNGGKALAMRLLWGAVLAFVLTAVEARAQRQMEKLGRGMIALRTSSTQVYVGWRLLGNDPGDVGFNLYRSANGGAAVKVNSAVITNSSSKTGSAGVTKILAISFDGTLSLLGEDSYSDTLVFTIAAK